MKNGWIGVLLAVVVAMTACVKPEDVQFDNVESFDVHSISGSVITADLGVGITNQSGSKLLLKEAVMTVNRNGSQLMEIQLRDQLVVPRRSSEVYALPLMIRVDGLGGLLGLGSVVASGLKGCTVSVEATVRAGWTRKKFRFDDLPAEMLLREAGIDPSEWLKQYPFQ